MNSRVRIIDRIAGKDVDRIPNLNIMMTFAAHYIGKRLSQYYLDYTVLCKANIAVQEEFHLDVLQAISDPYREASDLGAAISFPEDGLPICKAHLIQSSRDIAKLEPSFGPRMNDRLGAIRYFHEQSDGSVPVMGWVEGALALAAVLTGVNNLFIALIDRSTWLHDLLEMCCEFETSFATAQVEAGADMIGLGDAVASQISPPFYREFALPYEKRIFSAVKKKGALTRLHICGNTTQILNFMVESGADIIDIDWMVDIKSAAKIFGNRAAVCGNQDPSAVMRFGTPQQVKEAVRACMRDGGSRWLSAAGCEIPKGTPKENLLAQAGVLKEKL